jgi:hypothetical protein
MPDDEMSPARAGEDDALEDDADAAAGPVDAGAGPAELEADDGEVEADEAEELEAMRRLQEEIGRLSVADHLVLMLHSLSSLAVDRLGFAPETAERRDLEQARMAIDGFKALLGVLEGTRPAEEIAAHRAALSQLQMAYVAALGPSDAGSAPGAS